jgi:hypothetical protein
MKFCFRLELAMISYMGVLSTYEEYTVMLHSSHDFDQRDNLKVV